MVNWHKDVSEDSVLLFQPPTLPKSERRRRLQEEADSAAQILQQVFQGPDAGLPALDVVLEASEAVGFVSERTIGCGIGAVTLGRGFVLRRLEGWGRWSGPAFFRTRKLALGPAIGSRRRQRLLLIRDEDSLESFLGVQFSAGAALKCARDSRTARTAEAASLAEVEAAWSGKQKLHCLTYNLDRGLLFEASLRGKEAPVQCQRKEQQRRRQSQQQPVDTAFSPVCRLGVLSVDEKRTKQLLGPYAAPARVLLGEVQQPVQFAELYNQLNRLSNIEEEEEEVMEEQEANAIQEPKPENPSQLQKAKGTPSSSPALAPAPAPAGSNSGLTARQEPALGGPGHGSREDMPLLVTCTGSCWRRRGLCRPRTGGHYRHGKRKACEGVEGGTASEADAAVVVAAAAAGAARGERVQRGGRLAVREVRERQGAGGSMARRRKQDPLMEEARCDCSWVKAWL
ncbi:hypothetical protein N2152v2_007252 [Parachlorella kessleri]